jgi:hypothetical protein
VSARGAFAVAGLFCTVVGCHAASREAAIAPENRTAVAAPIAPVVPTTTEPSSNAPRHSGAVLVALEAAMQARGLASSAAFASRRVSRAEMERVVRDQVEHELPPDALAHEEAQQKLLSIVARGDDYRELVLGMLGAQVAGLYVPRDKALYVVDDGSATAGSAEERTVLVHEIVHAIQDEHFDLGARVRWHEGGGDETAAIHALGEGDATLAMLLETSRGEPIPKSFLEGFTSLMRESNRRMVGDRVPPALADALVDPYVEGMRFVWALYERGGWGAINTAWRSPPATTEQLLHLGKYDRREPPLPLPETSVAPAGFASLTRGPVGELDLRDWLGAFLPFDDASALSTGWGNGRVELFGRGAERALHVRIRWDEDAPGKAAKAARGLANALGTRYGAAKKRKVGAFTCVERADVGPLALAATSRELVVLAGPVTLEGNSPATATCASLEGWAARAKPSR